MIAVTDMKVPRFAPYANGTFQMAMGLIALDLQDWIDVDRNRAVELREKERLLARQHDAVFRDMPGSEAAQREVLMLLLDNLERCHSGLVAFDTGTVRVAETGKSYSFDDFADHALDLAGRLVQEDLCLMTPSREGYVLHAASLCFPARWVLGEKLGRPMMGIHEHVSGYAEKLGKPVDRFFTHLKADKPVARFNWSVIDNPALFQTSGKFQNDEQGEITAENAGARLWLRIERQTLRRLPQSGDILFTIRTFIDPLSSLEARPDLAAGLRGAVADMPEAMQRYKSLIPFRDALDGYLAKLTE